MLVRLGRLGGLEVGGTGRARDEEEEEEEDLEVSPEGESVVEGVLEEPERPGVALRSSARFSDCCRARGAGEDRGSSGSLGSPRRSFSL